MYFLYIDFAISIFNFLKNIFRKISPELRDSYAAPIKPLKLVIMSATLRVDDFKNPLLFSRLPPGMNK
jgi:HrpA-like RNA helicase